MFHIGHLNLLKNAKEICDYLIVAVNVDSLILHYKNKLPIIPYEERIKIIESIKYVDIAVYQENLDKIHAYDKYNFNVIFIGDDWKGNDRWNKTEAELNNVGVDVIYLPYTKHVSSTLLRKKILE
jgi:glycerol-3-phosphate cytidylyltransferase